MAEYLARLVDPLIAELLEELPALALVGPRASGKTTTAARYARTTLRLDRRAEALAVEADPDAALEGLAEPILLDEWQEVPHVLGAVKRACDAEPRPGRFILTGSIRAETETQTWPGTGRITRVLVGPMTIGEQFGVREVPLVDRIARGELGEGVTRAAIQAEVPNLRDYLTMALRGGFPQAALTLQEHARRRWLDTYVEEIVTRDSQTAGGSHDKARLARFFEAYSLNSAGVVDDTTLCDAAGINRRTALRYIDLLSRLHIVDELPAWTSNRLKRLSLARKRFLADPALLASVTGTTDRTAMRDGDLLGRLLETLAVAQLRAQAAVSEHRCRLYHLRQHHGRHEIDVVAELDSRHVIAIEIKATAAPSAHDARHLAWLRDHIGDRLLAGIVLHAGPSAFPLSDRLWALPLYSLWTDTTAD
ncbi:ATP-binding protein [Candidatus Poriferisodalis sp.]|uniref:ATP-binding protein n=1 Tax=Candidatus Poriferisodalis sp. TaxID=3101277 RepID=UPI003B016B84